MRKGSNANHVDTCYKYEAQHVKGLDYRLQCKLPQSTLKSKRFLSTLQVDVQTDKRIRVSTRWCARLQCGFHSFKKPRGFLYRLQCELLPQPAFNAKSTETHFRYTHPNLCEGEVAQWWCVTTFLFCRPTLCTPL